MAHPERSQEDYDALKQGVVQNFLSKERIKAGIEERRKKLDQEIIIPDQQLKDYVDNVIREDLRWSSYDTLIRAKSNPEARIAYYNFINAYRLMEQGEDSYGNICCMAIDLAKERLKEARLRKRKKQKKRWSRH